ncbi:unnamed protein product, partial [Rotaria sp. Silwood2]
MSQQPSRRFAEDYLVIWVDGNIDVANEDCQNTMEQLRAIVNQVQQCTTAEQCIQQLVDNEEKISFIISTSAIGQHLVPDIHDMETLNAIFIYYGDEQQHQLWAQNWPKIKGVHTTIKSICKKLEVVVKQCNQDQVTVSIISTNEGGSSKDLDQLEPTFMYSQIFKEILLDMEHGQKAVQDLVAYCQEQYHDNKKELTLINEFRRTYEASTSIW